MNSIVSQQDYLIFKHNEEILGINVKDIETIIPNPVTRIFPNTPIYFQSTCIFKETLIPILNFSFIFNHEIDGHEHIKFAIVVQQQNDYISFKADEVFEVIETDQELKKSTVRTQQGNKYIAGTITLEKLPFLPQTKQVINIIDVRKVYLALEEDANAHD